MNCAEFFHFFLHRKKKTKTKHVLTFYLNIIDRRFGLEEMILNTACSTLKTTHGKTTALK